MPLFDRVTGIPLEYPPKDRLEAAVQLIKNCVADLNFFFLHAAEDSLELLTIANDWKDRVGNLEVFGSQDLTETISREGVTVVGMRAI